MSDLAVPVLPHNAETERAVLGAILVSTAVFSRVSEIVGPADFSIREHRTIFSAMRTLAAKGEPIEILSLYDALKENQEINDAGGAGFIASLGDGIHSKAPVEHWAKMVRDNSIRRSLAYAGESLTRAALEPHAKAEDVLKHAQALAVSFATSLSGSLFGILASEVKPERVEWLWDARIPLGKITVLDGDPGLGKSVLTLDLAARITTESRMPDGTPGIDGGAVVLNAEDGMADTIVPRLIAMGAKLERVRILKTLPCAEGGRQPEIPGDIAAIETAAKSVDAKLVIVDPLMAFLAGTTNSFRDQDVRRALAPLAEMAERTRAAVLVVRHLNKNPEGNALYRGGGSIGIIGAARSGLLVARDPDDETGESRILAATKANLAVCPASLRYSIQPHGVSIRLQWGGESAHQASALLAAPSGEENRTTMEEAEEFLRSVLEDGSLSAKDVLRKGEAAGFSDSTLKRAKTRQGIKARRQGFGAGSTWVWELPAKNVNESAKSVNSQNLASFEQATDSTPIESSSSPKSANSRGLTSFGTGLASFAQPKIKGEL